MANYTSTPYSKANFTAILAIPRSELPAAASSVYPLQMAADTGVIYKFDPDSLTIGILPTGASGAGRWIPVVREVLQANRTYFVRTDGNDANNGLANTSVGAFATWQGAFDAIGKLDLSIFDVTISQGNNGTLTGGRVRSANGSGKIIIQGDIANPSNCVMSSALSVEDCDTLVQIRGIRFTGVFDGEAGSALTAIRNKGLEITGNCDFANTAGRHIYVVDGRFSISSSYTISGGGLCHLLSIIGSKIGTIVGGSTITVTGTPTFNFFAFCSRCSVINMPASFIAFSGSAIGQRYVVESNGAIFTNGGVNHFPGNSAGTEATGGRYL